MNITRKEDKRGGLFAVTYAALLYGGIVLLLTS